MTLRGRSIAAALISCAVLAACGSGGGMPDSPAPTLSQPATSPDPPTGSPTPSPDAPVPGDISLGDLNTKSFRYAGGCGFEVPAQPVTLVDGKQADRTPGFNGRSSTAEWTSSKEITLGDQQYLVVTLTCRIGPQKFVAAHLIGRDGRRPTDLGIIATGTKITITPDHDQLKVTARYPTIKDGSGRSSYKITMAGLTPIRLFAGERAGDIDPAIARLPAHGYDAGLVGISGYVDQPSQTSWVVGMLDKPNQVLTAESLGGGYGSGVCWVPTVHTQAGEKIAHKLLAYNGAGNGTGTAIELAKPSKANPGVRGTIEFPIRKDTRGLLIPANGVVPALATATTGTRPTAKATCW